ncbi:MAG: Thiamine biosynthesis lipoprotein ApbE precursor [Planctomycetota bacterium]|jgi:thiamine biosynthesis lipoprotein
MPALFKPRSVRFLAAALLFFSLFSSSRAALAFQREGATTSTTPPQTEKAEGFELEFPCMGTTVILQAYGTQDSYVSASLKMAQAETERLVSILSDYDEDSELSNLNQSAGSGKWVAVSQELWDVLEAADHWNKVSRGAFDASVGALTKLWRKSRRLNQIPTAEEIQKALQSSGWQHVYLDPKEKKVQLDQVGLRIDLGAIAKGYIVDRAFDILVNRSHKSCMVNAGGDLRCGDPPPNRVGWKIEIAALGKNDPPLRRIQIRNAAIATSGDLWQFIMIDGKRRSHILDPKTGMGVVGPISVSAIAEKAIDADAAATALSVLGQRTGVQLAETLPKLEALIMSRSDEGEVEDSIILYSATSGFATGSL